MHLPYNVLNASGRRNPFPDSGPLASPLREARRLDFLAPVPVGIDTRGEPVTLPLAGSSLLIGGIVASGISSAARHTAAAAILDPTVELAVFDGLDMGDWDEFKPLACDFAAGTHPCAISTVSEALGTMADDIEARCEQLHRAMNTAHMRPRLVVVAEAERYTLDDRHSREILGALLTIAKRGPRAGYALVLTTHQPQRLARELRAAIRHRLALYAPEQHHLTAILGTSARELGLEPADLPRQAGTGILRTGGEARLVRGYYLTDDELDLIAVTAAAHSLDHDPADD